MDMDSSNPSVATGTNCNLEMCSRLSTLVARPRENNTSVSECRPIGVPRESRDAWVQLLKTVNGLTEKYARMEELLSCDSQSLGFETSVLEPCVLVLRSPQQRYHFSLECPSTTLLVVETKSGNKPSRSFKKRFTVGHWEVGKGKFSSREVMQAADGSMRVVQPATLSRVCTLRLSEKLRKQHSGDATDTEKNAVKSVLGAIGY